ncbi:MAG: polyamine aminopropyltransferase [Syntrophomonadaceae bacterium]|nr:polyamine aminopropyltransferase [Syntrophomonadaceae bacterium]MDD3889053.1 polyamine aminopropyltransferase [Syntrophomonadaceae bacterium]MDD4549401.1 polyamine aminopropyltransferase [Syntrophomonadaceae bacterium]
MSGYWMNEINTDGYRVQWKINNILHTETTDYQQLSIVDTVEWGKALVLDGALQVSEKDEFIYNEMITHIVMHSHPQPEKILIIGGGDGGALREVVKHKDVKAVDMVEIDGRVIENCKKYLPSIACAFDDPRLNLYLEDGIKFVANSKEKYDVVIIDSSDPVGPAVQLYSKGFYENVFKVLASDGMMVAQSESPIFYQDIFVSVFDSLSTIFAQTYVYLATVPTYVSGPWSFTIGSKKYSPLKIIDDRETINGLKYYNAGIHKGAFNLPQYVKELLG